jgi:probable phosphoglycerate mutase
MELWLVRHGETTYSFGKRVAGWSDPPLTERGREQAQALKAVIDGSRFDGVWSSDLVRAVESARLAWGEPTPDRRLRECNFGSLEGCTYAEADGVYGAVFRTFRDFQAPDGESHDQLRERIHAFLDGLPPGRHLLVVHGGVIRVITQDLGLDRFVATGSLVVVDWPARRLLRVHEPGNIGISG